jgi:hypothetical protein
MPAGSTDEEGLELATGSDPDAVWHAVWDLQQRALTQVVAAAGRSAASEAAASQPDAFTTSSSDSTLLESVVPPSVLDLMITGLAGPPTYTTPQTTDDQQGMQGHKGAGEETSTGRCCAAGKGSAGNLQGDI